MSRIRQRGDRDRVEGRSAVLLYEALSQADVGVLDDPGFWRYLELGALLGLHSVARKQCLPDGQVRTLR